MPSRTTPSGHGLVRPFCVLYSSASIQCMKQARHAPTPPDREHEVSPSTFGKGRIAPNLPIAPVELW